MVIAQEKKAATLQLIWFPIQFNYFYGPYYVPSTVATRTRLPSYVLSKADK